MEKKSTNHQKNRRNYKRFAAGLAGAVILAGTSLHGIPIVKAATADNPSASQTAPAPGTTLDKDKLVVDPTGPAAKPGPAKISDQDKHDTNRDIKKADRDKPERRSEQRYERYAREKWADRNEPFVHRMEWYNDSANKIQIADSNASAVDIVMSAASTLGFDVNNDSFTLTGQNGSQSIVTVVHDGVNYSVTVDQSANGDWTISSITQLP